LNQLLQNGATALHFAAQSLRLGRREIIQELLRCGILNGINEPDVDGNTPLHYAASKGQLVILELLLKQGADVNARDNVRRVWGVGVGVGVPPRVSLARVSSVPFRDLLAPRSTSQDGRTALHSACVSKVTGRRMICETIIEHGLRPEDVDVDGNNALHCTTKVSKPCPSSPWS